MSADVETFVNSLTGLALTGDYSGRSSTVDALQLSVDELVGAQVCAAVSYEGHLENRAMLLTN